jgi:hypothetical protein
MVPEFHISEQEVKKVPKIALSLKISSRTISARSKQKAVS